MTDKYNLHRFLDAQERVYDTVLHELRAGRKSSHWIWFIFPQIAGLGHSGMAQKFAIDSLDEAKAYLQHPVRARNIHENFYCNRRYTATTSLTAGGLAAQSVDILFQVCLPSSQLRAPVSHGVLAVSSRTLVNTAGWVPGSEHVRSLFSTWKGAALKRSSPTRTILNSAPA
ncbi:hypothetical protein NITLEN_30286 [Nitrospira lenta]|uniref:Calpastatin n=1 Tax=Nitrospira lenta TaxID=1436998 RepID=A0A330L691_9BACT|nr:hypothetical protein NITLEN_30286 [Nitrospira lenta]